MYGTADALLAYPWTEARKELIPEWIREHPCSRPWAFWEFDAPGPRRRVGGSGRRERNAPLNYGVPSGTWFTGVNVDDPPRYESESAYLLRLDLLTATEKKWLADHPEVLSPEAIEIRISTGPEVYYAGYSGLGFYEERTDI
jgi:hypothetical protein